jgi:tetratricopeptide (TPR) repeat protein
VLHGDLDTIVAKALKKHASERYASVTALADDLWRFLRHEPISARPDTLRYRTVTFVRRHRASIGTVAAVVALIGGLTVFHTLRLSTERDRAQREAAKAVKASELMMGLLASADPFAIRPTSGEPTIRGLLDATASQVQRELAGQPELQTEMLTMMGRTYRRLAAYDTAQQLLEQALETGRRAFGPEHVRVAETLNHLGVLQAERGHYAAAARTLEDALTLRRKLLGSRHGDVAVTLAELGRVYQDQALNDRAEPLHREALEIRRTVLGNEHPEVAVSLSDLASVLRLRSDLATAETLLQQSLELNRKTRGPEHPNTSTGMHDLALIAASRGDYGGAESQLRQVLALQRKAPGAQHPNVASTLNTLSRVLGHSQRYDEAAAALREALDIARARLGADHPLVAIYSINAGAIHLARRDPAAAEPLLREGLRVRSLAPGIVPARRRTFLDDDWSIGATKSLLGAALGGLRRHDEAEAMLLDALRELESSPNARRADVTATVARLAELYSRWGKHAVAAAYRSRRLP